MSSADFSIALAFGAVSSLHCAAMCGPVVLAYSLPMGAQRRSVAPHLAYNAGRAATYMLLGALAGGVGTMGHIAGIERGVTLFAGVGMLLLAVLGWRWKGPAKLSGPLSLVRIGANSQKVTLGFLMGFLPCGMVYAALLKAMETATPSGGALTMLAFAAGTAVPLLSIGLLSSFMGERLIRYSQPLGTAATVAVGVLLLWRGAWAPALHVHSHGAP
jgi:sulfite exporter TauE/SafE